MTFPITSCGETEVQSEMAIPIDRMSLENSAVASVMQFVGSEWPANAKTFHMQ
ncbi:hypothetical protein [Fulvimarina endophytica]|uniref:hypothetical protein n=1 Tax=Fulvimarina endophytica TaxID=2293836 RepID=UPI001314AFE0|nr:hypothetical protein [Fulvimarina endophytica]